MAVPLSVGTGDLGGAAVAIPTTNETLAVTSSQTSTPQEVALVLIVAAIAVTTGAATTALQLRIRRGVSVAGQQVGQTYNHPAPAAGNTTVMMMAVDQQINTYFCQYSLTVQQTAATANGTVTAATIFVLTF